MEIKVPSNGCLVTEERLSRDQVRQRGQEQVRTMLGDGVTLDDAMRRMDANEFDGTIVEAELRLLKHLLAD